MTRYRQLLLVLFLLHVVVMSLYLRRVPGLLGDEGSEGENVFQILDTAQFTIYGERSYIGPLLDYTRIPFILAFGYSALPLRIVVVFFSSITLGLAASVTKKVFGETASLYIVTAIFFSPVYLLYQRLGWAITIIPFFAVLIIWLLQRQSPWKYAWAGLAAGIGLHNHFIFLPTLAAIAITYVVYGVPKLWVAFRGSPAECLERIVKPSGGGEGVAGPIILKILRNVFAALVSFAAGFGTQLAVLLTVRDDQGDPGKVIDLFMERAVQLPEALPAFISGSVFSAFYTGTLFLPMVATGITILLGGLVVTAALSSSKKIPVLFWILAAVVQLVLLVIIVDRFAARYFVMTALSVWGLAGYGLFVVVKKTNFRFLQSPVLPILIAITLAGTLTLPTFINFLERGGSTADITISSVRREPAAAFVDIRPLLTCLQNRGSVKTENVHIYNRLLYLSHSQPTIAVTEDDAQAQISVDYRTPTAKPSDEELCPHLKNFQVLTLN